MQGRQIELHYIAYYDETYCTFAQTYRMARTLHPTDIMFNFGAWFWDAPPECSEYSAADPEFSITDIDPVRRRCLPSLCCNLYILDPNIAVPLGLTQATSCMHCLGEGCQRIPMPRLLDGSGCNVSSAAGAPL